MYAVTQAAGNVLSGFCAKPQLRNNRIAELARTFYSTDPDHFRCKTIAFKSIDIILFII